MPSQQDQAEQGDAGVPRRQGPGAASMAHAQNDEPQANQCCQTEQNDCGKDHAFSRIKVCDTKSNAAGFELTERAKRAIGLCAPARMGAQAEDPSHGASFHPSEKTLNQTAREVCPIAA